MVFPTVHSPAVAEHLVTGRVDDRRARAVGAAQELPGEAPGLGPLLRGAHQLVQEGRRQEHVGVEEQKVGRAGLAHRDVRGAPAYPRFRGDSKSRTSGKRRRIVAADSSMDPLSTTMISAAQCVWARTRSTQSVSRPPPLKLMTTTLTAWRRWRGGAVLSAASWRSVGPANPPSALNEKHSLVLDLTQGTTTVATMSISLPAPAPRDSGRRALRDGGAAPSRPPGRRSGRRARGDVASW